MRVHNFIIVCSGKAPLALDGHLDQLIQNVHASGRNPILVVGPDGDELLRSCRQLEQCDLVFDPNFTGGFFSSLKAGLHATVGAAFVASVEDRHFTIDQLMRLEQEAERLKDAPPDVLRLVTQADGPVGASPYLVTLRGVGRLKSFAAEINWHQHPEIKFIDIVEGSAALPMPS